MTALYPLWDSSAALAIRLSNGPQLKGVSAQKMQSHAETGRQVSPTGAAIALCFDERAAVPCRVLQRERGCAMYNIFYIIGVIVVVLFILGYLGLR
jgi:hypothetical protein